MTWTYSGNPSSSDKDAIRYLIGDTDTNNQLLSDEEIAYELTRSNVYGAAALSCNAIVAKLSRLVDTYLDRDIRANMSQAVKNYQALARNLEFKARLSIAAPFCGGVSVSDKESREQDTDRVSPYFKVTMDDYT
jgi:hypothetical protein